MTLISLSSPELASIDFFCKELPNDPSRSGNFTFLFDGSQYDVTEATLQGFYEQLAAWGTKYSSTIRINRHDVPVAPVEPVAEVTPPVVVEGGLSDEDVRSIAEAVTLLDDKTIAKTTPIMEAQAMDESKPVEWRKAYLETVITDERLQKTLREQAAELLEVISA